jgi:hypothetical protein
MKIKITFLVAVAAALFGVSAASASAHLFLAHEYLVLVKALSQNPQGFEIPGAVSICKDGHFMTGEEGGKDPEGPSETLLIHPLYLGCSVSIGAVKNVPAEVLTKGCNYVFHALAPSTNDGTVDVECEAGKAIEIKVTSIAGCVISVESQSGLKTVEYVNLTGGKVDVNAKVSNIAWKAASACSLAGTSGNNAKYEEGEITPVTEVNKLTGNPARALSEGIKGGLPDAIMVE